MWFDVVSEIDRAVRDAGRIYSTGQIVRKVRAAALASYRAQGDDETTAARVRWGLDQIGPGGLSGMVNRFVEGRLVVTTPRGVVDQRNYPGREAFANAVSLLSRPLRPVVRS